MFFVIRGDFFGNLGHPASFFLPKLNKNLSKSNQDFFNVFFLNFTACPRSKKKKQFEKSCNDVGYQTNSILNKSPIFYIN
jgi:hypothetical protein